MGNYNHCHVLEHCNNRCLLSREKTKRFLPEGVHIIYSSRVQLQNLPARSAGRVGGGPRPPTPAPGPRAGDGIPSTVVLMVWQKENISKRNKNTWDKNGK